MIEELKSKLKNAKGIVILGVGNELRRDDAVGLIVARQLSSKKPSESVKVIECGEVPENYLGVIERIKPSHVIVVDALDMGAEPGSIGIVTKEQVVSYPTISTHKPSPHILISYIEEVIGAKVVIIGIQPEDVNFGEGLTPKVEKAAKALVEMLLKTLGGP
ncbi:MAG: hydrogenase maturation peptidase HycI [archaeon GB-1867-005]|nr:hydrogenase maturation peptidase HycI [Candidatus Culexmicrobium cathedralense]